MNSYNHHINKDRVLPSPQQVLLTVYEEQRYRELNPANDRVSALPSRSFPAKPQDDYSVTDLESDDVDNLA